MATLLHSRHMRETFAIAVALIVARTGDAQPTHEEVAAYPHAHAAAVYRSVLDVIYRGVEKPGVIVVADSLSSYLGPHDDIRSSRTGFDPETLENLIRITSIPYARNGGPQFALGAFPRDLRSSIPVVLQSQKERDSMNVVGSQLVSGLTPRARAGLTEIPYWTVFRKKYPTAWGLTVFTRVGFNAARTEALVQVRHGCGVCYSAETVLLRREPGSSAWRVKARISHWSESHDEVAQGSLRHVGRDASMRAARVLEARIRQRDSTDSVRRERAPRRIRGTVVNARTGGGMSGHPVYQLLGRDGNPDSVAVTDARGNFAIIDPAVGGWALDVQCSRGYNSDRSVGSAGFYVGPGLDTSIVILSSGLDRCWNRRIRPPETGELESPAYANSPFPDSDDSQIYELVMNAMFPSAAKRPMLFSETVARCGFDLQECAGYEHISILLRERVIDSATYSSFTGSSQPVARFNTAFARRTRLPLLTPGIVDYMKKEARATPGHSPWEPEQLWFGLRQAYPEVNEILSFTRVNYNADKTHALVSARLQRGPAAEHVRSFLLERVRSTWQITRHNLEAAPLTAEIVNESCVIARGGGRFPQTARSQLRGVYRFTFVATSGAVEHVDLDVSPLRRSRAEEEWDWGLKHLLKIRSWSDTALFGTWRKVGSHGVPVDNHGNRLPEISGHFCATSLLR